MSRYESFKKYESGELLTESELKFVADYLCGYLNNPVLNSKYYYDMYSYISKSSLFADGKMNMDIKLLLNLENHLQR